MISRNSRQNHAGSMPYQRAAALGNAERGSPDMTGQLQEVNLNQRGQFNIKNNSIIGNTMEN